MQFTLIMPNGKEMKFYVRGVAELYQRLNGGVIYENGRPALRLVA